MLRATPRILRIAPEQTLPIRFHAQIRWWSLRSGAIMRIRQPRPGWKYRKVRFSRGLTGREVFGTACA